MADSIGLKYELLGEKELKAALKSINDGLRVNKSEMELVTATYANNTQAIEALAAKENVLNKAISLQKEQVSALADAMKREIEKNGESSTLAMKRTKEYNKAQAELLKLTQQLGENTMAMEKANMFAQEAGDGAAEYAQATKKAAEQISLYNSELKLVSAQYGDTASSAEALNKESEIYSKMADEQSKKVDALAKALEKSKGEGKENSDAYRELSIEYNNAQSTLLGYEQKVGSLAGKMQELVKAEQEAGDGTAQLVQVTQEASSQISLYNSELKLVSAQYGDTASSAEALNKESEIYSKMAKEQARIVESLEKSLEKAKKENGESSEAVRKLSSECNNAKSALLGYERQAKGAAEKSEELAKSAQEAGDGSEKLAQTTKDVQSQMELLNSELKLAAAKYGGAEKSAKALSKESAIYSKMADEQARVVAELAKSLEKAKKAGEENGEAVRKLSTEYNNAQATLLEYQRKSDSAAKKSMEFGKSAKGAGNEAKGSSKGISAMTVALGELIAKGIEMAITGLLELTEKMREYNMDMSRLAQNTRDAGISQEIMMQQMKELNFITGETDSNIEALSNLMAAGFKDNNLGKAVETLSGAVIKFPDTMKIESLADSLQETLATGEATGQFAELLGRVGIEAESFNEKLERQTRLGQEQQFVLDTLARVGLPQVALEYGKTNAAQKAYADAQFELNESMAQIAKEMVPLMTDVTEEINLLLQEHSGEIVKIIELIAMVAEIVFQVIGILAMVPAPVWLIIAGIITAITAFVKLTQAFSATQAAVDFFTKGLSPVEFKIMQIVGVVLALVSVLALLAMLWLAIKEGSEKAVNSMQRMQNVQISPPQVNQPQVKNAYAKGTLSAANGWALVGEEGPELVAFSGGERVMNARKTSALLSDGISDSGNGAYIANLNIYPNAQQWGEVMNLLKQSKRAEQERRKR